MRLIFLVYNDGLNKMPFSPFYNYDSSDALDDDYFYMQSIIPESASDIMNAITDECDKLEYEGSYMFDEYPDKLRMLETAHHITDRPGCGNIDESLLLLLLANEMLHRRRRHRCRRNWDRKCYY